MSEGIQFHGSMTWDGEKTWSRFLAPKSCSGFFHCTLLRICTTLEHFMALNSLLDLMQSSDYMYFHQQRVQNIPYCRLTCRLSYPISVQKSIVVLS
uniref:Uncharacterized protein n=1 Tax=Oryza glumipatula TaxID=40148 RepID=A0A0E0AJF7_9ORYZ